MNPKRCYFQPGLRGPSLGPPHNYTQYLDPSSICQSFFQTYNYSKASLIRPTMGPTSNGPFREVESDCLTYIVLSPEAVHLGDLLRFRELEYYFNGIIWGIIWDSIEAIYI